jgi:hypothetical protein
MSRQEILDRERRWRKPTLVTAGIAVALLLIANFITPETGDTIAESQRLVADDPTRAILQSALIGLGLAALVGPLFYVFSAAKARSESMLPAMIGFVFIGPLLFGATLLLSGFSRAQVADDFVAAEAAAPQVSEAELRKDLKQDPGKFEEVTLYTESDEPLFDVETSDGTIYSVEYDDAAENEEELTEALQAAEEDPKSSFTFTEEEQGDAGSALLLELGSDSSLQTVLGYTGLVAQLALVIALIYTSLHAMRNGLFTRFFGTMCMALAVAMVLLPIPGFFTLAPLVFAGGVLLILLRRSPGGLPPAWDAGESKPWPKPGEEEAQGAAEVLEGDASEVEDAGAGEDDESPHAERRQRAKRKKRKRR